MSNYTKSTNFAVKDGLSAGTAAKRVRGTEIDDEYNAIAVAVATKANTNNATLTGTPTAPTAAVAINTTQLATTAYVQLNKVSPALTGVPTAPTASSGTNTTQLATTAFANAAAAVMPAGSVLQVLNFTENAIHDTTSAANVFGGLTGAITPSATSSKILVTMNVNVQCVQAFQNSMVGVTAYRGSGSSGATASGTNLAPAFSGSIGSNATLRNFATFEVDTASDGQVSIQYLDSPSSTSSVNYQVAFRKMTGAKARLGGREAWSTMTLMEIKG